MKNLPISNLNSGELYTTAKRIINVVDGSLSENEYVAKLCSLLILSIASLAKGLGKSLNSDFTPIIFEKDLARDNAFIGLRDFISSFCHSSNTAKLAAATFLAGIIEKTGNTIYSLGYTIETSKMNTLLTNLSEPAAQTALSTIGATEWYQEVVTSEEEFETTYKTKIETESTIDYPLVKDSRAKISKYLKSLLNYIETNTEFDSEKYSSLKDKINEIITDSVAIARARITRLKNEKTQGTTDNTTGNTTA
jgi:hypothetical protein